MTTFVDVAVFFVFLGERAEHPFTIAPARQAERKIFDNFFIVKMCKEDKCREFFSVSDRILGLKSLPLCVTLLYDHEDKNLLTYPSGCQHGSDDLGSKDIATYQAAST